VSFAGIPIGASDSPIEDLHLNGYSNIRENGVKSIGGRLLPMISSAPSRRSKRLERSSPTQQQKRSRSPARDGIEMHCKYEVCGILYFVFVAAPSLGSGLTNDVLTILETP
jgi:hypothetical protein